MTIASTPIYPTVGQTVKISLTNPQGNTVRGEVTSVPSGSKVLVGLTLDPATKDPIDTFVPDIPGVYGVNAHDWRVRHGISSYKGDPAGASSVRYLDSQSGTIAVGDIAKAQIATLRGDGATLQMTIVDDTVRAAEFVAPLTETSRRALLDAGVVAALAGLVGVVTSALDVDFVTDVVALCASYENHRIQTGGSPVHLSADVVNIIKSGSPLSPDAAIAALNEFYSVFGAHETHGVGGGNWHYNDDGANTVVTPRAKSLIQAVVMKANLRESYRRHIATVGTGSSHVHTNADTTALSLRPPPLPLPALIVALLDAIVATAPATPAGEQVGMTHVVNGLGFTRG